MTATPSFRRLGKTLAAFALLGVALLLPAGNAVADDLCSPFVCSIKSYYADAWFGEELVGEYIRDEYGVCTGWGTTGPWVTETGYLCAAR